MPLWLSILSSSILCSPYWILSSEILAKHICNVTNIDIHGLENYGRECGQVNHFMTGRLSYFQKSLFHLIGWFHWCAICSISIQNKSTGIHIWRSCLQVSSSILCSIHILYQSFVNFDMVLSYTVTVENKGGIIQPPTQSVEKGFRARPLVFFFLNLVNWAVRNWVARYVLDSD